MKSAIWLIYLVVVAVNMVTEAHDYYWHATSIRFNGTSTWIPEPYVAGALWLLVGVALCWLTRNRKGPAGDPPKAPLKAVELPPLPPPSDSKG